MKVKAHKPFHIRDGFFLTRIGYQRIIIYSIEIRLSLMINLNGISMDNQNEKDKPENTSNAFDLSKEEPKNNDTENNALTQKDKNGESEKDASSQWVREILEDRGEPDDAMIEELDHLPVKKGDLPDWINTLSQSGQEPQLSDENIDSSQQSPNEIRYKSLDDSWDTETPIDDNILEEQKEELEADIQPDEGFVEISQFDLEASENIDAEVSNFTEPDEDQEELPDWLEEMIEEPVEAARYVDEISDIASEYDEPTKPVIITREDLEDEDLVEKQTLEESTITSDLSLKQQEKGIVMEEDEIAEYSEIGDFGEEIPGGEKPITEEEILPIEEPIDNEILVEDEELPAIPPDAGLSEKSDAYEVNGDEEEIQEEGFPKTLKFAKYLLDQGEIDPSFEIFQTYVKKSAYLEEIKAWVQEAVMVNEAPSNLLWELLGDIAFKQNEPNQALTAYTKAISLLMKK